MIASEPFVHFTLLGALVFAAHSLLTRAPEVPVIEVSASKQREIAKLFEQRLRRPPSQAERQQLIQRHIEDEVLFREGLRLSLVNTDPMLREQLIARVRGMIQAEIEAKQPAEAVTADYRKDRTSRAFQAELARLTSEARVHVAEQQ
jgi:Fe2+ transport system protein B